jgi:hypothetical protein
MQLYCEDFMHIVLLENALGAPGNTLPYFYHFKYNIKYNSEENFLTCFA